MNWHTKHGSVCHYVPKFKRAKIIMKLKTIIVPALLIISVSVVAQKAHHAKHIAYSDSGFTNKAEAKNKMVKGLKEGKWIEYLSDAGDPADTSGIMDFTVEASAMYYSLTIYKADVPYGVQRDFYVNGTPEATYYYMDGKLNGINKEYYRSGQLQAEYPFKDDFENGEEKEYYENGKLKTKTPYINDTINGVVEQYNTDGILKKETLYYKGKEGISKSH